ncbi:unnamed protein product [Rotaria sp. Silwood1]|nr:unnamed protein product [Rotaria sp. Silwood1]
MSGRKEWPELVGQTFQAACQKISEFDSSLTPYNARNGQQDRMYDPTRVVCVTNDNDIITEVPYYNYESTYDSRLLLSGYVVSSADRLSNSVTTISKEVERFGEIFSSENDDTVGIFINLRNFLI